MNVQAFTYNHLLDTTLLNDMYGDSIDDAIFGFEQFTAAFPSQMEELEGGYASHDVELFRQKVHKIKPSFGFVGLPALTEMAQVLEKKCRETTTISTLEILYTDFKTAIADAIPIVHGELQRMKH